MNIQAKENVALASKRLASTFPRTPLISSSFLNDQLGHELIFKAESLQKTGSFKVRGVMNSLLALKERNALPRRLSAYSTGNHGLALAWASKEFGIELNLYLPAFTSQIKQKIANSYGANVILTKTRSEAEELAIKDGLSPNCMLLPPSDNDDVIAGAGTACYEALSEQNDFDAVFTPCGGGGLVSGTYLAAKLLAPKMKVFAAEPKQANDAAISLKTGEVFRFNESPETLADGAKTLGVVPRVFEYLQLIDGIYEITEREIAYWTAWANHLLKIRSEYTSALATAAAHRWLSAQTSPKKVLIILTGGNVDSDSLHNSWAKNFLDIEPIYFTYDEE